MLVASKKLYAFQNVCPQMKYGSFNHYVDTFLQFLKFLPSKSQPELEAFLRQDTKWAQAIICRPGKLNVLFFGSKPWLEINSFYFVCIFKTSLVQMFNQVIFVSLFWNFEMAVNIIHIKTQFLYESYKGQLISKAKGYLPNLLETALLHQIFVF